MVQLDEPVPENSEASKGGLTTIADVGRARIRAAAGDIQQAADAVHGLDLGFRAFRVEESNRIDVARRPDDTRQEELSLTISGVQDLAEAEALLFEVLLSWGVDPSMPISSEKLAGFMVYDVNDGDLMACFDSQLRLDLIRLMAERTPMRVVFLDSGFQSDAIRINAMQILAEVSPSTDVKVI